MVFLNVLHVFSNQNARSVSIYEWLILSFVDKREGAGDGEELCVESDGGTEGGDGADLLYM